jgi:NTE family protein
VSFNNGIGLALGGGAARGLAGIGVLAALEERRIEVRAAAGTSMGGLIGALHCNGYSSKEITNITHGLGFWSFVRPNISSTLPHGLCSLRRLRSFLADHLPDQFEDLKKPYQVVATDIDTGEAVRLDSGSLLDALIATASIPILFPPVKIDSRLLVDGGIVEQVPARALLAQGVKPVVAVSFGFVGKRRPRYRGIHRIGVRALDLMGKTMISEIMQTDGVIPIYPDVEDYGAMNFAAADKFIEAGRRAIEQVFLELEG